MIPPKRAFALFPLVAFIGILLTWGIYVLRSEKRWDDLDISHMEYPNGWELTASEHGYGQVTFGPGLTLPSGRYIIEWEIDTDADNIVTLTTDNHANLAPANFTVHAGEHHGEHTFTLLDPSENLQFLVFFESGSYLNVGTISMRGTRCSDRAWLITLILLSLCAVSRLIATNIIRTRIDAFRIAVLVASVILASLPAFRSSVSLGHDGSVHIERLRALVSALSQWQFPVRVSGSLFNGYGSLFAVFYPALILYPAAFMVCCHASIPFAFQFTIIAITLLSGISMFIAGRKLFGHSTIGLIAAVLYLFAPYRLTNVFTRVALGEAAAMAFLPLFILEFNECLFRDRQRWPYLAIYAALLVHTHLLTALFCAISCTVVCLIFLRRVITEKRFFPLCSAILLALGLSLSLISPMMTYSRQGIDISNMLTSMSANTLSIGNLVGIADVNVYYWHSSSRSVGLLLVLSNVLLIVLKNDHKHYVTALSMVLSGIFMCFMTTSFFPWEPISRLTNQAVDIFQFPYRLLIFIDAFLALSGAYAFSCILHMLRLKEKRTTNLARSLCLLTLLVISVIQAWPIYSRTWTDQRQYSSKDPVELFVPPDYLLTDTSVDDLLPEPIIGKYLNVRSYEKFGTTVTCDLDAQSDALLTLPLFAFDGYSAALDGHKMPVWLGDNNRLTLFIKAGTHGTLTVCFAGKPVWRLMDMVSILCLLAMLICIHRKKRPNTRLSPVESTIAHGEYYE